jgi:hypothetical protein
MESEKTQSTHVDRIDVSRIRYCGHDQPVTTVEKLGVPIFCHPDGKPCKLLNCLCLDGDMVNEEDPLLSRATAEADKIVDKIDDPIVYSRLSTDKALIKRLARELDREKDKKRFQEALLKIGHCEHAVEIFRAVGDVLGAKKRHILLNNVTAIFTIQYRDGSVKGLEHLYPLIIEAQQLGVLKSGEKTTPQGA